MGPSRLRMTLSLSLLLTLLTLLQAEHAEWEDFKRENGRRFNSDTHEHAHHKAFNKSLEYVNRHNAEVAQGRHTFTVGINELSDLTDEERDALTGYVHPGEESNAGTRTMATTDRASLPASVNWTAQGYVTPVKHQGSCSSCWAISAAGAIEGLLFRTKGTLTALSPQNLVDCVYPSSGCTGGAMSDAFDYVIANNGIASDAMYPYVGASINHSSACGSPGLAATTIRKYVRVEKTEAALLEALANVGPIATAVNASGVGFINYKSGVYNSDCAPNVNHAVLLVGYGTDDGTDYWLVKNSWGVSWGINGYIKIARNVNNMCGIANSAVYPTN